MRRFGFIIAIGIAFLGAIILIITVSPHLSSTSDSHSYYLAFATHYELVGTARLGTGTAAVPSRTAIALTRDPLLIISLTPNEIQLTLTDYAGIVPAQTATHVAAQSTATASAILGTPLPTFTPPDPCEIWMYSQNLAHRRTLSTRIQTALVEAGFQTPIVNIVSEGVTHPGCGNPFIPLQTTINIDLTLYDLNAANEDKIFGELTAEMLSIFGNIADASEYGLESARLSIVIHFWDIAWYIDTDYANALAAYNEGLRGEALLEALGGILPG
jgi:hypothetical protein